MTNELNKLSELSTARLQAMLKLITEEPNGDIGLVSLAVRIREELTTREAIDNAKQAAHFTKGFGSYVCDGDIITCVVDGITYIARLERDTDAHVDDYDCYDETAIAAWQRDEWHYFGVVIDAEINGWHKGSLASLWGIEGNFPDSDNSYFLEVANDLLPEAIASAKASLPAGTL